MYLDPKVAVGTIISNDSRDEIAMVRRAIEPGYGKWVFPGVDTSTGAKRTADRRCARSVGRKLSLHVRIDGLVNIYSYAGRVPVIIVYAATLCWRGAPGRG